MIKKLLIIDANVSNAKFTQKMIESNISMVEIFLLTDLSIYDSYINQTQPDIILFDLDSPSIKIEDNIDLIKEISKIRVVPIITFSEQNVYEKVFESGAINFILKPYNKITLLSNLKTALNLLDNYKNKESEIAKKDKKIQAQIHDSDKQREIIQKKNQEIMADIRYASRIQQAVLPTLDFMNRNIGEYFILHQPKNHVSGDFYWVSSKENKKIIAVGDCTGHGISGALMHMLGAVYLNEIVSGINLNSASEIIEKLRDNIMRSLNQKGESGEAQDGLDLALCILDFKKKKLQFAGANNPLYIVRNQELIEIKGDRMPVGIHINFDKPFTNHEIDLKSSDQLYLFSDGYADQFGGPKGKKFRYKQFKDLLLSISHHPMEIQKEIINNVHDKWRGSLDQIDDILVFGLKIK